MKLPSYCWNPDNKYLRAVTREPGRFGSIAGGP